MMEERKDLPEEEIVEETSAPQENAPAEEELFQYDMPQKKKSRRTPVCNAALSVNLCRYSFCLALLRSSLPLILFFDPSAPRITVMTTLI